MKYFISFIEEGIQNPDYYGYVGGRIEVYSEGPYAYEEIRFLTTRVGDFTKFRDEWDFKHISESELNTLRNLAKEFYE